MKREPGKTKPTKLGAKAKPAKKPAREPAKKPARKTARKAAPPSKPHSLPDQFRNRRLLDDSGRFSFGCHPGLPCFTDCCADVNIFLTPYDVLRLRRRLGLEAQEFLARHTILPFAKTQTLPVPLLRMKDDAQRRCPFVGPEGCTVYEDRPWPCRMYPVGVASSKTVTARAPSAASR